MLLFPASLFLVPSIVMLGVVYLRAGRLRDSRPRASLRLGILFATCVAPALTRGPGPAQLILGLVAGYLGIRMVALSHLPSVSVMGFFLLHAGLVLAEKRLGWHQEPERPWPLLLARIRTLVVFAALSPLLLDPFACVTHVHGRAF